MRLHKRYLLLLLVLLAGLPVIPTMAGAEATPTVEAKNEGSYTEERHSWSPTQTMVALGGTVAFANPSTTNHGIEWVGGPSTPACTSGVPVGTTPAASGANWNGTCTFAQAGVYRFYCTVHGAAMQGRVVVGATGIITTTASTTQSYSTGTTTTTTSGVPTPETLPGPPLVGSASEAIKLTASQHGTFVRGSVAVAQGGAGGKLEVDLLARKAVLAKTGHAAQTRVGRLVRSSLTAGRVSFKVSLSAKAKRALRTRRRLALTVRIILTPTRGSAVTVTRHVILHA
jgi:plastocyanin